MKSGKLWRIVGVSIAVLVGALLVRQVIRSWPAVSAYPWRWRWPYLVASLVVSQIGYMTLARAWRSVLRAIRIRLHYTTAYWLFLISNLGRYLPGKVWQIGAAALLGRRLGLPGSEIAASMVAYQLYLLPVGAVLTLTSGRLPPPYNQTTFQVTAWLCVIVAAFAALWPHLILKLAGAAARRLGLQPERWRLQIHRRIAVAGQCGMGWLFLACGFGFFVMSVTSTGAGDLLKLGRIFVAAYIIGYATLVTPGGLGVREGVLALLLGPLLGAGPAAGVALLSRLWVTVTELLALIPALLWANRDRRRLAAENAADVTSGGDPA